ncbi:heparinase II/III family protein [Erythrobacter crassostreae]|uniref:Heparinase II/III family protein n=1 Tax=Erythrobacter crassostreae TaxID=2828328 RepID=A0A9X1JK71_9SPHN|nr:heparinase II/III family protein [Erythrobacter crassostrea]MBV7258685.1 heparinase II/III family protein [Erythrobacter crassostrea]
MATLFRDTPEDEIEELTETAALPLGEGAEPVGDAANDSEDEAGSPTEVETSRALALTDVIAPRSSPGEALIRMAYRMGVPGHALAAPFRRAAALRVLATVDAPAIGNRAAGTALRAGHFLIDGVKLPIAQVDFGSAGKPAPRVERTLHSFSWLADLAVSAPREDCVGVAERITSRWLEANCEPAKGAAWDVENAGLRLLAWLVHAPLVLGTKGGELRPKLLAAIQETAGWLDRKAVRTGAGLGQIAGLAGVTAAGLLLPEGKPRRLYGEAALIRALGDLVGEDGGVLARCPEAQMDAIAILTNLLACYEAAEVEAPEALIVMRELLVPPLLVLRHGDGGLGSWQGNGAIAADRVASLLAATGIRKRPLKEVEHWGFHRLKGGKTIVQFDAAPPPRARHVRNGCASTLAFEMSDGASRLIVNCGGSSLSGGQIPARIGQGLRATAAHSTLILDNANSTAVLLHGKLGRGAETVEVERQLLRKHGREAHRVEASHDGYGARFGLTHQRVLSLRSDGTELAGEDILLPVSRKGKRGKIGFAIRFHLGRGVEAHLSEDRRGASLLTPDGKLWQFRLRGDAAGAGEVALKCEDSLWVDGDGRPHSTEQLVIEGLTSRGGGQFSWLLKKMG